MKTLKRVLFGITAVSLLLFAAGCQTDDDDDDSPKVSAVTFSPAAGSVAQGTTVTLSSTTEGATIYWSTENALTSANYGDDGTLSESVTVTENCTIYAIAVDENGNCSSTSSAAYQVTGPNAPTFELANGDPDVEDGFYTGVTTLTIASATEGAKIYYSTTSFAASAYASQTEYTGAITLTGALGAEVTYYAVAVGTDGPSMVTHETFTSTVRYVPMSDDAKFTEDGGIAAAITAIGDETSAKTFDSEITVSGYVTMTNGKSPNGTLYIQDATDSIMVYGYGLDATAYAPGEYVTVVATKGQLYHDEPEISGYTSIEKNAEKNTTVLYYKNFTGLTDFSGLETIDLCGIKADKDSYTENCAIISSTESGEKSYFGYVSCFSTSTPKQIKFVPLETKAASVIGSATSTLTNTVDTVVATSSTTISLDSSLTLFCVTPDAVLYYTTDGTEPTTSSTKYSDGITFTSEGEFTVTVLATKEGYTSSTTTLTVTVGDIDETLTVSSYTDASGSALTDGTNLIDLATSNGYSLKVGDTNLVFAAGTNTSNSALYYSAGVRWYGGNTLTLSSSKTIGKIKFEYVSSNSNDTSMTATSGSYDADSDTWIGLAKSVTFTNSAQLRFTKVYITYADGLSLYDTEVSFDPVSGTSVTAGSAVSLSTTETGATIYYSTDAPLTYKNYLDEGTVGNSVTINEETTIYAILVSSDAKTFSAGTSASYTVSAGTATKATSRAAGDVVYMYCKGNVLTTETASGSQYKLAGAEVTPTGSTITLTTDMAPLTVEKSGEQYRFKSGEVYLTALGSTTGTSGTLKFAAIPTDDSEDDTLFTLSEVTSGSGTFYITSVYATVLTARNATTTAAAMIEFYSGFSSYKEGTGEAYEITFYKVSE